MLASQMQVRPRGRRPRAAVAARALVAFGLLAAPALPRDAAHAGRQESASFLSQPSEAGLGGAKSQSPGFEDAPAHQEVGLSTSNSAGFGGRAGFNASAPQPRRITDLAVVSKGSSSITLDWTAPVADQERGQGRVARYLLRYSVVGPISTDADFASATVYNQNFMPLPPGLRESRILTGLDPDTRYYFVVEAANEHSVRSERSVQASTVTLPAGCATGFTVRQAGGEDFTTISGAVDALPASLSANACVVLHDAAVYPEQVTVQNFALNGSSITILRSATVAGRPSVDPPAGSTAAFHIRNASVAVVNIDVRPTVESVSYGVFASSGWVTISSVNVDSGGRITQAGIRISSWSTVAHSSVSVQAAHGIHLDSTAERSSVRYSTASADSPSAYALFLSGASSNTFSVVAASNPAGAALRLDSGARHNSISGSDFTSAFAGAAVSFLAASDSNTIAGSFIRNTGTGLEFDASDANTLSLSTVTSLASAGYALRLGGGAKGNRVSGSRLWNAAGTSLYGSGASANVIAGSTLETAGAGASAAHLEGGAGAANDNVLRASALLSPAGYALRIEAGADRNAVSLSTLTSAAEAYPAVRIAGSSNTLVDSYVQGSTAVHVAGATGTVVGGSVLVATHTAGHGLRASSGSLHLTLSSSTLSGGPQGAALRVEPGNRGRIALSTNTYRSARFGVYLGAQQGGTELWLTSSTILPTLSEAQDTYGVYLDGLASGATIQDNGIYLRAPGSAAGRTAYGLYAAGSARINIDHNRFNDPGMITAGSHVAIHLDDTDDAQVKFNDVHAAGSGLSGVFLLRLANGSTGAVVRGNVFLASAAVTGAGSSSATLSVSGDSQAGFSSDFNDFFSSATAGGSVQNSALWGAARCVLPGWSGGGGCPGQDAASVARHPLWADPSAGAEDFHPRSLVGRFDPAAQAFVADSAHSGTIDAGDPSEDAAADLGLGLESAPNGGRANQGSYGRTAQASRSALAPGNPQIAAVHLSSMVVTYSTIGAPGYVVEASSTNFGQAAPGGLVYSSATANPALDRLAPQGLDPNTTYFLRAGADYGGVFQYAGTTPASTATLSNLVAQSTVSAVHVTSITITWVPLPASPPDASSRTAAGYLLQASSTNFGAAGPGGTLYSSATWDVNQGTLTITGLFSEATYYFRVASLNRNGAPNFAGTISAHLRDRWPPEAITNLSGLAGAEGEASLAWTAPEEDAGLPPTGIPVAAYAVRLATFSASLSGSATAWWDSASAAAGAPAPLAPGATQGMVLGGLEPGVTYFFAVRSLDDAGNLSPLDTRAQGLSSQVQVPVFDAVPPAPANLSTTSVSDTSIGLAWSSSTASDLDYYSLSVDSTPPYDFADAFALAVDSPSTSFLHAGLLPGTTYAYRLSAVDKGAPPFPGLALESAPSNAVQTVTTRTLLKPMEPFGIGIQVSSTTAALSWLPVRAFESGVAFAAPGNPAPAELTGYRVYRATAATRAPWSAVAALSTATLAWNDAASGAQYYYHVRAENTDGLSGISMIRSQATLAGFVLMPDGLSVLEIPAAGVSALGVAALDASGTAASDPDLAYRLHASTRGQDLGGRVLKSVDLRAWKGGTVAAPDYELPGMAVLRLRYEKQGAQVIASGAAGPAALVPTPNNMSVYWFNGQKWVQLFGRVDETDQLMILETKYLGLYQLRSVERAGAFDFNPAGLSNRLVTPNGDGKNDFAVFTFDNPRDSEVAGRVYDLKGAEVATMTRGPLGNSLMWDGKAGGRPVPGGVYIYQIEAEGNIHNGTLVVIH